MAYHQPLYALCSVRRHPKRLGLDTMRSLQSDSLDYDIRQRMYPIPQTQGCFLRLPFSCTADTDRQTIAAEEGLTELCANVYSLPGIYDMANIETRALQVIVIFL